MANISDLAPQKVWEFFSEITAIPHGSGNEQALTDHLITFAEKRNLKYEISQDNLFIYKDASIDKKNNPPVMLQAHLDMVTVKDHDVDFDFTKDPIKLIVSDEYVKANGTTLGADNGIGIAMIMAILDDNTSSFPAIKAIFTIGEETDMVGANRLVSSEVEYPYLINIDSEVLGEICVGCAGGISYDIALTPDILEVTDDYASLKITISNALGGHSGIDIGKKRINAGSALLTIINTLSNEEVNVHLSAIEAGIVRNSIPSSASAIIALPTAFLKKAVTILNDAIVRIKAMYKETDDEVVFSVEETTNQNIMFSDKSTKAIIALRALNTRVLKTDANNNPILSANVGTISFENGQINFKLLARFNEMADFEVIKQKLTKIATDNHAQIKALNSYPNWESSQDSHLLSLAKSTYHKLFSTDPKIITIHAGLECGLFSKLNKNLEIISIGPTILNAHSTDEKVDIASTDKCFTWLKTILNSI